MLDIIADTQGCNWHSFETDSSTRQAGWDRVTYNRLADLASQQPNLCKRIPFLNVWTDQARATQIWFQDLVGDVSVYDFAYEILLNNLVRIPHLFKPSTDRQAVRSFILLLHHQRARVSGVSRSDG